MIRSALLTAVTATFLGTGAMTVAVAQTYGYPQSPPQSANNQDNPDMDCRQQAAAEAGYPAGGNGQAASSDVQQRYAAAYYDCMRGGSGGPQPNAYAYGPPPPAYGPPPPYYYGPDPYAYPYYPPYYGGPAISFGFGFGGRGHWR
jgi:hypothetical protein